MLPLLTYSDHKVKFTNPKLTNKVTYSDLQGPTLTYSDPKVTYIDHTHPLTYHTASL